MGSVIDYIECPHCGEEAYSDFYYKSGEEYISCSHCGYQYSVTIKNRNKKYNELTRDDWEIKESFSNYGVCKIKSKEELGYGVIFLEDEDQFNKLKTEIEESIHNGVEIESFCLSRYIDNKIEIKYIIGTKDEVI